MMRRIKTVLALACCMLVASCAGFPWGTPASARGTAKVTTVFVMGGALNAGVYTFEAHERCTLSELVRRMGGRSTLMTTRNIRIVRGKWGQCSRRVPDLDVILRSPAICDVPLIDGDRVVFRSMW